MSPKVLITQAGLSLNPKRIIVGATRLERAWAEASSSQNWADTNYRLHPYFLSILSNREVQTNMNFHSVNYTFNRNIKEGKT